MEISMVQVGVGHVFEPLYLYNFGVDLILNP